MAGKAGQRLNAEQWQKYVDSDRTLKSLMVSRAPKWANTLGQDILGTCRVANQRAHGEVGDAILLSRAWFTDEQIWVLGCILTKELYVWRADPEMEGYSDREQREAMENMNGS